MFFCQAGSGICTLSIKPDRCLCRLVIEPISANSLECMNNNGATSFQAVTSLRIAQALQQDKSSLPEPFREGVFCEEFQARLTASARTWQRPHAQENLM